MLKRAMLITLMAVLTSCLSIGPGKIADSKIVAQVTPGVTTKQEVRDLFGPPAAVGFEDDNEHWVYIHYQQHLFAGASTTLTVVFSADGRVKNIGAGELSR